MKTYLEKIAGEEKALKGWGTALKFGLGSLGITLGSLLAGTGYHAAKDAINKKRYFNKMLQANPELETKKESIKPYFNSLLHFAPMVAAEPLAAGAFIKRQEEFKNLGGLPLMDVKNLSDIQEAMTKSKSVSRIEGPGSAAQKMMQMGLMSGM